MTNHAVAELLPAYALDALDEDDRRTVEAHLASCAACRDELAALRESTAALALTAPALQPPPELRARVLARATGRAVASPPAGLRAVPTGAASGPRSGRAWQWLAAASLVIAAASGAVLLNTTSDRAALRDALARADAALAEQSLALAERDSLLARVLGPEVEIATLTATDAVPSLRLFRDRSRDALVLAARRLPPASAGRTYQLWGIGADGQPVGLGTFNTGPDGTAIVVLNVPREARYGVSAVTEEPAGGSAAPTTTPFLVGSWPASGS